MEIIWPRFNEPEEKPKDPRLLPYQQRINEDEKLVHFISAKEDHSEANEILVTRNEELCYSHYLIGDFDLLVSDQIKEKIESIGWKNLRSFFEKELSKVEIDPFGENSIDPDKNDYTTQQLRSVNLVSEEFNSLVGESIALKRVITDPKNYTQQNIGGKSRDPLTTQFINMRRLVVEREKVFTSEEKEILDVCPVYLAIRYPINKAEVEYKHEWKYKDWIVMKKIDGEPVQNVRYAVFHGSPLGFKGELYPELQEIFGKRNETWEKVSGMLNANGFHVGDMKGQNIIVSENDGKRHYTLIDQ